MSPGRFLAEHTSLGNREWMAWHKLEEVDRKTAEDKAKGSRTRSVAGDAGRGGNHPPLFCCLCLNLGCNLGH